VVQSVHLFIIKVFQMNNNQQIRRGFFETNSSSTHSLVVQIGDIITDVLTEEEKENGCIIVSSGEFGWEIAYYHDFRTKLQYLVTYILTDSYNNPIIEHRKMLEDVIQNTVGCSLETTVSDLEWCGIDHQSIEGGLNGDVFESEEILRQFLFNDQSYLRTGNDNE
jgi:hypothetical protein